jgi:pimeloyl-ACP methyl ester carboxylesterase
VQSDLVLRQLVVLPLLTLAACGGWAGPDSSVGAVEPASTSAPAAAAPSPRFTDLDARCREGLRPGAAAPEGVVVDGPEGLQLRAGLFGAGAGTDVAMVLLHQTDRDGLCGWVPFATAAASAGIPSVAFDLCGYGETQCLVTAMGDAATQVGLAARLARDRLGARRVVVVGASMGGSQTVRALAQGLRADGWVDVSGPGEWLGDTLLDLGPVVPKGGLVVHARTDGAASYADARALARCTGSTFVDGGSGHGYDLLVDGDRLTPVGRRVLVYVRGV